jgi:hypothetical protein
VWGGADKRFFHHYFFSFQAHTVPFVVLSSEAASRPSKEINSFLIKLLFTASKPFQRQKTQMAEFWTD